MKTICLLISSISTLLTGTAFADEPKGYTVNLTAGRIGNTDVDQGEYKLLIHRDEQRVQLKDLRTGEIVDLEAKVEAAESKSEHTQILSSTVDGVKQIVEIRISGTNLRINFRKAS